MYADVSRVCHLQVEYPVYWTYTEWVEGMKKLLDFLKLDKVLVRSTLHHPSLRMSVFIPSSINSDTNECLIFEMLSVLYLMECHSLLGPLLWCISRRVFGAKICRSYLQKPKNMFNCIMQFLCRYNRVRTNVSGLYVS